MNVGRHFGINRIRLEFKGGKRRRTSGEGLGINRIRLEFKADTSVYGPSGRRPVLIESDWNLKGIQPAVS